MPNLGVALRSALAAAYWEYASLGGSSRALILAFLQSHRPWQHMANKVKQSKGTVQDEDLCVR
jgi:hypothetical protein